MVKSDATFIFGDGTFEEQVQELVNYLTRGLPEDARIAFIRPFQESLLTAEGKLPISQDKNRQRKTITLVLGVVKGLGEGSDKEIEGFFNLLFAHVLTLFPEESLKEQLAPLIHEITSGSGQTALKCRILSNLFNIIHRRSPLRLQVYRALLSVAEAEDDMDSLGITLQEVKRLLFEWDVPQEDKSELLKSLSDAFSTTGQVDKAYEFLLAYVASLPPSSTLTESATLAAFGTAIRNPSILDFDPLLSLESTNLIKGHPLFALVQVFIRGGFSDLEGWLAQNSSILNEFELDKEGLERKMRLLTLATLGTKNVGKDLAYTVISTALHIQPNEVETWVINSIRANLISGKLSQPSQSFHITRATHRSFQKEDWIQLEKRLQSWRTELLGVLEVVANSRQGAGKKTKTVPELAGEGDKTAQVST